MSRINRETFRQKFSSGIDLGSRDLRRAARSAGVSMQTLRELDTDGDGRLAGDELDAAYELLSRLDPTDDFDFGPQKPGSSAEALAAAFEELIGDVQLGGDHPPVEGEDAPIDRAPDTKLYHGMTDAISDPRKRIIETARSLAEDPRLEHGYRGSQRMLSQNDMHSGSRRADGLVETNFENVYKCNLFIGDVLSRAGFRTPTLSPPDGAWEHYRYAEEWANSRHFDRVSLDDVRPGDVIVQDHPAEGSGGGHLEIVTDIERDDDGDVTRIVSIGSRWTDDEIREDDGRAKAILTAEERDTDEHGLHYAGDDGTEDFPPTRYFFIRPKQLTAHDLSDGSMRM